MPLLLLGRLAVVLSCVGLEGLPLVPLLDYQIAPVAAWNRTTASIATYGEHVLAVVIYAASLPPMTNKVDL
jgi:hypothetical protein